MEHVMDAHIKKRKGLIKALIFLAFVISAIVVVRFTPLKDYLTTEALTVFSKMPVFGHRSSTSSSTLSGCACFFRVLC